MVGDEPDAVKLLTGSLVAVLPTSDFKPSTAPPLVQLPPSLKVTVPVGVPPELLGDAVKVADCSYDDVLSLDSMLVLVGVSVIGLPVAVKVTTPFFFQAEDGIRYSHPADLGRNG